jgi:signal peptidase II
MSPNLRLFLAVAASTFLLDQGSKQWIVENLALGGSIEVIRDTFYLTHVTNPGAAFSMFADASENFRRFFFVGIGGLAIGMIVSFYRSLSPGDRLEAAALGSILGGALGNLFDRVARGEEFLLGGVVDWLHVRLWTSGPWPDFNLADSFIVIGVALLVFELFASDGEEVEDEETPRGTNGATAG